MAHHRDGQQLSVAAARCRLLPLVCTNGRPSAAALRLLTGLATTGTTLYIRADDDPSGQEIVARLQVAIPGLSLWRFALRPPASPRYEEQDLALLLRDLDRSGTQTEQDERVYRRGRAVGR
jgi:uncharacterized protein DUF2399